MQFARGFQANANRIAVKVRGDLGLAPEEPLDPWQVCDHFEIAVIKLSSLRSDAGEAVGERFLRIERNVFSASQLFVECGEQLCTTTVMHRCANIAT